MEVTYVERATVSVRCVSMCLGGWCCISAHVRTLSLYICTRLDVVPRISS